MQISQSDVVRVRRRRWRVTDVRAYERCQVLTLAGIEPANSGVEQRFITPFDVIERVERRSSLTRVSSRVWRRACRALIAASTPPGSLACTRLARIDLLPHQLQPALAVIRGLGSRVLLADDVGLGKTIQAGLILSELRALGAADRVLILTPAGLRDQWANELSERFSIDAAVLDVRRLRQATATLPIGVNPWQTVPVAIASVDYVKRTEVLAAAGACRWDVLIVDEAHGVAGDSERHAAVAALAIQSAYVVLLTATPHSGDRRAFASLCAIGATPADKLLVFRRSRHDLPAGIDRRLHRLHLRMSRDEMTMHALLADFSLAIRKQTERLHGTHNYWLALSVLHKRALSSARSLQLSIDRRLATLATDTPPIFSQLELPLGDVAGELTTTDEAPAWSPLLSLEDATLERQLLNALAQAASRAARSETKIAALARLLRRVSEPAIVFTEYRDTLSHVQASLSLPSLILHGGMSRDERLAVIRRFTSGDCRLLLATDAAGEGLNLQQQCRVVVNLELPWNPMRLEQRIGRVDRIGQRRAVHVFHLIARDSGEAQLLFRLQSRIARARADIGAADPLGIPHGATAPSQELANQAEDAEDDVESELARFVIAGETTALPVPDQTHVAQTAGSLLTPTLDDDGQAEARRIARARAFVAIGDDQVLLRLDALGPCVSRTRHSETRAFLSGRALMLWQLVAKDGSGRVVASTLVAVAVDRHHSQDDGELRRCIEHMSDVWRQSVAGHHHAFVNTRLLRERTTDADRVGDLVQPGLFDRRDERAHMVVVAARAAAARDRAERLFAIEQAGAISFSRPHLLLVLTA